MNLKIWFLTLSIKKQIYITIIVLNIFCILVIIAIFGSLAYEILKEEYKQKKLYFYNKYEDYIESCFYFQNYYFLQYEEIIKKMQKQIWENHKSFIKYPINSNFIISSNIIENINYDPIKLINITQKKSNSINKYILYNFCFSEIPNTCENISINLNDFWKLFLSLEFYHNINESFLIPLYEESIMTSPLYVYFNSRGILSYDPTKILEYIQGIFSNLSAFDSLDYINNIKKKYYNIKEDITNIYDLVIRLNSSLFLHMFNKIIDEIKNYEELIKERNSSFNEFLKGTSGYFTRINYSNGKFYIIFTSESNFQMYAESSIIYNYLYYMNNRLSNYIDLYFIPLFNENNTIISPELCIIFLLKQYSYYIDNKEYNQILERIIKGKSKIEDCLLNKNNLNKQEEIKDILNLNVSYFFYVLNSSVNQGIINLMDSHYYLMKYSYPNYNSLREFKSEHMFLDQINYYLFASFREPINFSNLVLQIYKNCFYLIMIFIVYIWYFCLAINLLKFYNISKQLIEPFHNLQKAIISSTISDQNIFRYKNDDFIDELFLTCKELLIGKIDLENSDYILENFNIITLLRNTKKDIDSNKYKKNLIINNDILNKLILEQQNMLDFSKNIQLNEYNNNNHQKIIKKISNQSSNQISFDISCLLNSTKNIYNNINQKNLIKDKDKDKLNLDDLNKISNSVKITKNKEEIEREDKEPYRKLFKIAEYLYYIQNKKVQNYLYIYNGIISNEKDPKLNSRNLKKSLKINQKWKKYIKKSSSKNIEEEEISINMIDNKNISYLWYMEAKKKKNKFLNYKVGNDYEGLFIEYNLYKT